MPEVTEVTTVYAREMSETQQTRRTHAYARGPGGDVSALSAWSKSRLCSPASLDHKRGAVGQRNRGCRQWVESGHPAYPLLLRRRDRCTLISARSDPRGFEAGWGDIR